MRRAGKPHAAPRGKLRSFACRCCRCLRSAMPPLFRAASGGLDLMFLFEIPIHKLIIHFPIALTIVALIYDAWAIYTRKPELHRAGYGLTWWAAVGALAAAGTGLQLAEMVHIDKAAVTGHAGFGITATFFFQAEDGI